MFPAERVDSALVERVHAVNFVGPVYAIEAALPAMVARGSGIIAGVSSIAAVGGMPAAAPYSASKAAFSNFLQSLRIDLGRTGVRVTTVTLGFVKTPLTDRNLFPMPFLQTPEAASRRIIRGIERGRREVQFPRRLTWPLKLLASMPGALWEWCLGRVARRGFRKTSQ